MSGVLSRGLWRGTSSLQWTGLGGPPPTELVGVIPLGYVDKPSLRLGDVEVGSDFHFLGFGASEEAGVILGSPS